MSYYHRIIASSPPGLFEILGNSLCKPDLYQCKRLQERDYFNLHAVSHSRTDPFFTLEAAQRKKESCIYENEPKEECQKKLYQCQNEFDERARYILNFYNQKKLNVVVPSFSEIEQEDFKIVYLDTSYTFADCLGNENIVASCRNSKDFTEMKKKADILKKNN
eukprot:Pgem_evm1s14490